MSRIYLLQAFYALEPHENDKRLLWGIFIYQTCPHIFITALVTVGLLTVTVLVGFCREQGGFSLKAESRRPREFAKESSLRGYNWTSLSASGLMKRMRPSCGSDVKLRTALHPLHHEQQDMYQEPRTRALLENSGPRIRANHPNL